MTATAPYYSQPGVDIYHGSAERLPLADETVQTCITSPPYFGLRDYGVVGQIGMEESPAEYVETLVRVFREVRRVLKSDGTLWLNLGDSYATKPAGNCSSGDPMATSSLNGRTARHANEVARGRTLEQKMGGCKYKDLLGVPWSVAFALRADGWYLRSEIIWHKTAPMPESVTDRPTKAHEQIFLLAKSERYFYDADAIKEPCIYAGHCDERREFDGKWSEGSMQSAFKVTPPDGRNKRSVWTVNPRPYPGAHFATFPPDLIEPCVKAGSRPGDLVLDPFNGSGTTGEVCRKWGRRYVGVELNAAYIDLSAERFRQGILFGVA